MTFDFLLKGLHRTDDALRRHPRRLTAAVVVLLSGTAMTAFGVAPLAPDAADLPRTLVAQSVTPLPIEPQLEALELHDVPLYRSELSRAGDTADTLLRRLGVDDPEAAAFLRKDSIARGLLEGRSGKMVRALAANGRLIELVGRSPAANPAEAGTHFTRLTVKRDALGFAAKAEQAPMAQEVKLGSGSIQSTLFAAADESGLPDAVTGQMAELFSTDIDFRREIRRGDRFTVLYETLTADGEPVPWGATGRVLAAQFVNGDQTHDAVWFQEAGQKGGYFSLDGRSKTRHFLASPLIFTRVSSGFAMRFHPLQQSWRQHLGIDYAAPTGTAVRSVGDGVVTFAGWQNGYGNIVVVEHADQRETRYAHLSRIDAKRGQSVGQGQLIGAVGATGWATGPHLHFEFLVNGRQVDPVSIARSSAPITISAAAKAEFQQTAAAVSAQLAAAPTPEGKLRFE